MDIKNEYSCLEQNRRVFSKSIDFDNDYQETIPAYCDDIYRVVKCCGRSYITSVDISFNEVKVFGKNVICLTYFNENSNLCYADFEEDFSKTVNVEGLTNYAFASACVSDKYTNFRVINQRRIDVHISGSICLNVYDRISCSCLSSAENAKLKTENVKSADIISTNVTRMEFDEEFSLPSASDSIKRIISYTANSSVNEIKIIKDKALIKANVNISVLYTTDNDDETVERAENSFSVSKIVEASGTDDGDIPITTVSMGNVFVKAKAGSGEKLCVIETFGEIISNTVFIRENDVAVVTDGYVPSHNSSCVYSDCVVNSNGKYINENKTFTVSSDIPAEVKEIKEIAVTPGEINVISGRIVAGINISALYNNSADEPVYFTDTKELEIPVDNNEKAVAAINIISFDYSINSTLDIRINAQISAFAYTPVNYKVLSDISADDEIVLQPGITVYFGSKNDELWDIAKRFSSDTDLIMRENTLTSDTLDSDKVLIIPRA